MHTTGEAAEPVAERRMAGGLVTGRRAAPELFAGMERAHPDGPTVMGFHGGYVFAAPPDRVWEAIRSVESLSDLWSWLHVVDATEAELSSGVRLDGVVSPPIPWQMRVSVRMDEVVPGERIHATVSGDLRGPARLRILPEGSGSTVAVAWCMAMQQPAMRVAARVSRRPLVWGHDQVVATTIRSLRDRVD